MCHVSSGPLHEKLKTLCKVHNPEGCQPLAGAGDTPGQPVVPGARASRLRRGQDGRATRQECSVQGGQAISRSGIAYGNDEVSLHAIALIRE